MDRSVGSKHLRGNRKGLFRVIVLTCVACSGAFMWGYDSGVVGGVLTLPSFIRDFNIPNGTSAADKATQATIASNCVSILQAGGFFGAILVSPFCARFGRKKALMLAATVFTIGAILQTIGTSGLGLFYAGRIIAGLGVGAATAVVPVYVSEMAPKHIRGVFMGLWQFWIVTGTTVSYFIDYAVSLRVSGNDSAQWRIPVALQIVPGVFLFVGVIFLSESPRWLTKKHREEEGLLKLAYMRGSTPDDPEVEAEFQEILQATEHEREVSGGASIKELLLPGNRKRALIGFFLMMAQQFSGTNAIGYYAPQIFAAVGVSSTSTALFATGLYGAVKMIMTMLLCLFAIERLGRRKCLVGGGFMMGLFMLIIGILLKTHPPVAGASTISPASIGMVTCIYLYVTFYCFSFGPVPWIYASEIFPNRLREYCVALCAASQWLWNFVVTEFSPHALNTLGWGIFILFAGFNFINVVYVWFLPETTGKSLEEMDRLFGVPTAIDNERVREEALEQAYARRTGEKKP